ncbi:MAG: hypothetical protein IPH13_10420 [Planctomycetes bacterium]|nr:hypothetical protein [Planctomycetota bacterium]MCC7171654.1 hypothetical protein [Planctomycetota bacterium]
MAQSQRVRPHHAPLVAFEHLCIGAWLAIIVVTWTIVFADFGQRWKAEGVEVALGVALVFFALRRQARGLDLLLPFALLTLAFCGFYYVAPPLLGVVKPGSAEKLALAKSVAAALDGAETVVLLLHFVRTWRR